MARLMPCNLMMSSAVAAGEIATALHMADTQLDASTLTDQDYLIAELESMVYGTHGTGAFLSAKPEAQAISGPPRLSC
jgi:hypothetical protein